MLKLVPFRTVLLLALALLLGFAPQTTAKVLIEIEDPVGDDLGDGDYTYPTDTNFGEEGQADLVHCRIDEGDTSLTFTVTFRNLVDPWRVGNRLTFLAIAVDTGKGGLEELGHAAFAVLAAPAELVIYYGGETVELTDGEGNLLDSAVEVFVDMDANTLVINAPFNDIGKPKKNWKYTIAAGLQDDYGAGGIGDFRLVNETAEQWRGGGGTDLAINPNVYDVIINEKDKKLLKKLAPKTKAQSEILADYSLEENRMARLPYIKR